MLQLNRLVNHWFEKNCIGFRMAKSFANLIASEKLVGLAFKKGEGQWATISDCRRLNIPFQKCM
jgi:hypothetical protein